MSATYLIGGLLLLVALVGLHAYQSEAAGALRLLGFLAALVGTGLLVGMMWTLAFVVPSAAIEAPAFLDAEEVAGPLDMGFMLSGIAVSLGWALFGVATFRARVFPRRAAMVLVIGALLSVMPLPATTLVIDVALAWLGLALLSGQSRSASGTTVMAQPRVQQQSREERELESLSSLPVSSPLAKKLCLVPIPCATSPALPLRVRR